MLRLIYTQSCGKETPCGKSLSRTRVEPQALPDRFYGLFAGLRTTMRCLQLLAGKQRIQFALQATPMHVLKVLFDLFCHEKDCNSRIYGGVSHFPHINLQSRQETSSPNPRIPPIDQDQHLPNWISTRHREAEASRKPPGQKGTYKTQ